MRVSPAQSARTTGASEPAMIPAASMPRPSPNTNTGEMRNRCANIPKNIHIMASKHRYPMSSAVSAARFDWLRPNGKNSSATTTRGTRGRK